MTSEWWRTAAIYQIYPRSFADANGDGMGDLAGITSPPRRPGRARHRRHLALARSTRRPSATPATTSPTTATSTRCFGTLADFDAMLAEAHARGMRVIIDLVPNHSSDQHGGSRRRSRPPAGQRRARPLPVPRRPRPGRRRAAEQLAVGLRRPRLDPRHRGRRHAGPVVPAPLRQLAARLRLDNEEVREEFRRILRFWLDRGVDGFRVDVAHGMIKADGLPDYTPPAEGGSMGGGAPGIRRRPRARDRDEPATAPVLGPGRRARDLPRLAQAARRVPRRAHPRRRGLGRPADPRRQVGASRRDAPGVQLRLPRDAVGRRRPPHASSTTRSPRSAPSAPLAPGCSRTTTWCGTRPASR